MRLGKARFRQGSCTWLISQSRATIPRPGKLERFACRNRAASNHIARSSLRTVYLSQWGLTKQLYALACAKQLLAQSIVPFGCTVDLEKLAGPVPVVRSRLKDTAPLPQAGKGRTNQQRVALVLGALPLDLFLRSRLITLWLCLDRTPNQPVPLALALSDCLKGIEIVASLTPTKPLSWCLGFRIYRLIVGLLIL